MTDDPCDEWPAWKRWEPAIDARQRPTHSLENIMTACPEWDDVTPPIDMGRFNCRGEYVFRDVDRYRK